MYACCGTKQFVCIVCTRVVRVAWRGDDHVTPVYQCKISRKITIQTLFSEITLLLLRIKSTVAVAAAVLFAVAVPLSLFTPKVSDHLLYS